MAADDATAATPPAEAVPAAPDLPAQPSGQELAAPDRRPPRPALVIGSGPEEPPRTSGASADAPNGCTAPQLRRFIKSRPYVPMHELRRRFGINGTDDDVCALDVADGRVWVGLPAREGRLVGELLRGGDIGYELSLDPRTPIVVGLYPMRPVPRT